MTVAPPRLGQPAASAEGDPRACSARRASTASTAAPAPMRTWSTGSARYRRADASGGAEVFRFPPVVSRALIEKSGYLKSFPHLLGCVCALGGRRRARSARRSSASRRAEAGPTTLEASELVLAPAACYPIYPIAAQRGRRPARRAALRRRLRLLPPRAVAGHRPVPVVPHARIRRDRRARSDRRRSASTGWRARPRSPARSACRTASKRRAIRSSAATARWSDASRSANALKFEMVDPRALGREADRLHELQLPPRPFRPDLGSARARTANRPHRLRRLRHGPAGGRAVRRPRRRQPLARRGARCPAPVTTARAARLTPPRRPDKIVIYYSYLSSAAIAARSAGPKGGRRRCGRSAPDGELVAFRARNADPEPRSPAPTALSSSVRPNALPAYPRRLGDCLHRWAREAPDRVFLAERNADRSWRKLTYAETLDAVTAHRGGAAARSISAPSGRSSCCRATTSSTR